MNEENDCEKFLMHMIDDGVLQCLHLMMHIYLTLLQSSNEMEKKCYL